jgi:hypothetical protein
MSEESGGFYVFPLCVLASRQPLHEIMERALWYGTVHFIEATRREAGEGSILTKSTRVCDREAELERAQKAMGFKNGNIDAMIAAYRETQDAMRRHHSCTVRLKTSYHFDVLNRGALTEAQFRCMIGLYSIIGPKPYARCGYPMLQARAAGWVRPFTQEQLAQADTLEAGPIYSRGQLDRACRELIVRGIVHSFTFNRGVRYWSNRATAEEIAGFILKRKTERSAKATRQADVNAKLTAQILQLRET